MTAIRFGLCFRQVEKKLHEQGFQLVSIAGSHYHFVRVTEGPNGTHPVASPQKVTVPFHGAKDIKPGTLSNIRRQVTAAGGDGQLIRFGRLNIVT